MDPYSEEKTATDDIQNICTLLKTEVEEKTDKTFQVFTASLYRSLYVDGFIYLIKVEVGAESAIHLKVYHKLNEQTKIDKLLDLQEGHKQHDPIKSF